MLIIPAATDKIIRVQVCVLEVTPLEVWLSIFLLSKSLFRVWQFIMADLSLSCKLEFDTARAVVVAFPSLYLIVLEKIQKCYRPSLESRRIGSKSIEFLLFLFSIFHLFSEPFCFIEDCDWTELVIIALRIQKLRQNFNLTEAMISYFVIILTVSKLVSNCNNFGDFCDKGEDRFIEFSDMNSLKIILNSRLRERRNVAPMYAKKEAGRRVTETLDSLFEESSYDRRFRPSFGGAPTEIKVNIFIRSMGPVDESLQKFTFDCYFRKAIKVENFHTFYFISLFFHFDGFP